MAEMIHEWPSITRTRTAKYPWSEWTNGAIWQAKEGADFESTTKTFVQGLYAYGKRHGLKVEARTNAEGGLVAFRFMEAPQEAQDETPQDEEVAPQEQVA